MIDLDPTTATGLALAASLSAALAAAWTLPGLARRVGWVDAPGADAGAGRKLQARPVPAVGGAVCLLGVVAGWAVLAGLGRGAELPLPGRGLGRLLAGALGSSATIWPLGGALTAFAVGLLDDLVPGGLGPRTKLTGQALAGVVLGLPLLRSTSAEPAAALGAVLLLALGAAVAINAINTFDNADGAAGGLVLAGTLVPAPLVAAALLPFVARNLRRRPDGEVAAYLGDSGSHLLGMLVLVTPAAWPLLALPLLDLARLALERPLFGSAPWVGDRRHLAHRLLRAGLPRALVPAALVALALPTLVAGWRGVPLTALLALLALVLTRAQAVPPAGGSGSEPPSPAGACPRPGPHR